MRPTQPTTYSVAGMNTYGFGTAEITVQMAYSDTECFFNWVEMRLPKILTPAHQTTHDGGFAPYRAYSVTGVYMAVSGNSILAVGGPFGSDVAVVGLLGDYLPTARAAFCQ